MGGYEACENFNNAGAALMPGAWIASAMLTLRGVAGLVVDGLSDPIWWPTFLIGGVLFGGVAWAAALR